MAREQLAGWGGTTPTAAEVAYPADAGAVTAIVAAPPRRGVIARGLGRSYGDAAQNAGGTVIETTSLDELDWVDEASGVVRVAGGTSLDALLRKVVPLGWFVPVSPGTRQVTVGGAIAADIHGKNHHRDGTFVRHVRSFTLATATGVVTVTPESDADLFWATAGGLGLTGVVLEATVALLAIPSSGVRVRTERAGDLDTLMARMDAEDAGHRYSVAWVDGLAGGRALGRGVITWGDHARADELPSGSWQAQPLAFEPGAGLAAPLPPGLLNRASMRAFNELWYRKAPAAATTVEPIGRFFHPLDAVHGWNRLYGRRGFVQYQFVVPFGAEAVVRNALDRLRRLHCPAFLIVLKRFGAADPGPLSFPIPGWTLALDVPVSAAALAGALDGLDESVADAGGRVYLAKDARLRPELVRVMYPELPRWAAIKRRVDPDTVFTSDLGRRLGLVRSVPRP